MNKESSYPFLFFVFLVLPLFIVTFAFAFSLGVLVARDQARQQAISQGVAKYTVNPTNGQTKFEFIKP